MEDPIRWPPGVPRKGWSYGTVVDLGMDRDKHVPCELCGTIIRYVHHLEHPSHPPVAIGCVCAGHLTQNYVGAQTREKHCREATQHSRARAAFPDRANWRVSSRGTDMIRVDGYRLMVLEQRDGRFKVAVAGEEGIVWGKKLYESFVDAQRGCYDALRAAKDDDLDGYWQ